MFAASRNYMSLIRHEPGLLRRVYDHDTKGEPCLWKCCPPNDRDYDAALWFCIEHGVGEFFDGQQWRHVSEYRAWEESTL